MGHLVGSKCGVDMQTCGGGGGGGGGGGDGQCDGIVVVGRIVST